MNCKNGKYEPLKNVIAEKIIRQFEYICIAVNPKTFNEIFCYRHKKTGKMVRIDKSKFFWKMEPGIEGWKRYNKQNAMVELLNLIGAKCPQCGKPLKVIRFSFLRCPKCKTEFTSRLE